MAGVGWWDFSGSQSDDLTFRMFQRVLIHMFWHIMIRMFRHVIRMRGIVWLVACFFVFVQFRFFRHILIVMVLLCSAIHPAPSTMI